MVTPDWRLPPLEILDEYTSGSDETPAREQVRLIESALAGFGIPAQVRNIHHGPRLTQFSVKPGPEVQISGLRRLEQDLAVALSGALVAIEEARPDYPYITLVVENYRAPNVKLRRVLESIQFQRSPGILKVGLGLNTFGEAVVADLAEMPHLLVGGMTGSGKSIFIHATLASLLSTYTPAHVRLVLVDPIEVELKRYNGLPHLVAPVVNQSLQVLEVLQQTIDEIEERYRLMAEVRVRNIAGYNHQAVEVGYDEMPYLVVIIDNLFDLLMAAPIDLEELIGRIAQKARGAGIHLIMATVRSNVDVVAGSIKANFPGRIAFKVVTKTDSQLIIDNPGAEMLLGQGDMLYKAPGTNRLERVQGIYVSEQEIDRIINFWYRR
jgi:S-DNA-T family DNA segregation ATPase FtsK/SpoIIIE